MAPTLLYLVRHGQSIGNVERRFGGHAKGGLSDTGRAQAERAGAALAKAGIAALYTSDLERARETAAAIGAACGLSAIPEARLRERTLGVLDGLTFDEARERHPDLYAALLRKDYHALPQDAETVAGCATRMVAAIGEIAARHPGSRVALVTHEVAASHGLRRLVGVADDPGKSPTGDDPGKSPTGDDPGKSPTGDVTAPPVAHFALDNGAWHLLDAREGSWRIVACNVRAPVHPVPR